MAWRINMRSLRIGDGVALVDTGQKVRIDKIMCFPERVWDGKETKRREGKLIKSLFVSVEGHVEKSRFCRQITPDLIRGFEND
jgi:hypothetical protein